MHLKRYLLIYLIVYNSNAFIVNNYEEAESYVNSFKFSEQFQEIFKHLAPVEIIYDETNNKVVNSFVDENSVTFTNSLINNRNINQVKYNYDGHLITMRGIKLNTNSEFRRSVDLVVIKERTDTETFNLDTMFLPLWISHQIRNVGNYKSYNSKDLQVIFTENKLGPVNDYFNLRSSENLSLSSDIIAYDKWYIIGHIVGHTKEQLEIVPIFSIDTNIRLNILIVKQKKEDDLEYMFLSSDKIRFTNDDVGSFLIYNYKGKGKGEGKGKDNYNIYAQITKVITTKEGGQIIFFRKFFKAKKVKAQYFYDTISSEPIVDGQQINELHLPTTSSTSSILPHSIHVGRSQSSLHLDEPSAKRPKLESDYKIILNFKCEDINAKGVYSYNNIIIEVTEIENMPDIADLHGEYGIKGTYKYDQIQGDFNRCIKGTINSSFDDYLTQNNENTTNFFPTLKSHQLGGSN